MLQIENKSLFINQMFTRIAKKYDFLNNIMTFNLHQIWKKQAIESASVNIPYLKHAKVLDLVPVLVIWLKCGLKNHKYLK